MYLTIFIVCFRRTKMNKITIENFTKSSEEFYYRGQKETIDVFTLNGEDKEDKTLRIYYINTPGKFDRYFGKLNKSLENSDFKIVAIDTERDIVNSPRYQYKLARIRVMSICTYDTVLVISFSGTEGYGATSKHGTDAQSRYVIPKRLGTVLSDNSVIKTGISLEEEYMYLNGTFVNDDGTEVQLKNMYDLQIDDQIRRKSNVCRSYQDIVADRLKISISKDERVSKWGINVLSDEQIVYSAIDVICCMRLI